ncbi:MAG: TonB family protein [Candidatus Deferrimicrobiaceae bacterium]
MEHAESVSSVSFPEWTSARRERTTEAAWKGLAASLLLHILVGATAIGSLSGSAQTPPLVIDLTLKEPVGESAVNHADSESARVGPAGVPPADARSDEPWALAPSPAVSTIPRPNTTVEDSEPAAGTGSSHPVAPISPSFPVGAASGSPSGAASTARTATGEGGATGTMGNPPLNASTGSQPGGFAWIRDAIQRTIAYPATARKMGWEGKVVVAFRLLSDGSVRDVRVVLGSGHAALDRGAIDAVRNASPFPRSPVDAEVITPVVYRLTPAP